MPYLFDHLDLVREVAELSPLGLAADLDGTISEIAPSPDQALVSPECRQHLAALTRSCEVVAVVSGRPARQIAEMVGLGELVYIGNHGLEWLKGEESSTWPGAKGHRARLAAARKELERLLRGGGVIFEDKGIGLALHYRVSPDPPSAREAILAAVEKLSLRGEFSVGEGRMVVELRPPVEVSKGTALEALVQRYGLKGAIYLGDDLTDVDAFATLHELQRERVFRGLAVAVVSGEVAGKVVEEADVTLSGVGDVERFLRWLRQLFPGSAS